MNYERALESLRHARTKKLLDRKRLCNKTWLFQIVPEVGQPFGEVKHPAVGLELFEKHILTWNPDGTIRIFDHGYKTRTTADRLNSYMPSGFRTWQYRPYWYLRTPSGTRPFFDGMTLLPDGQVKELPPAFNKVDAWELKAKVIDYSRLFVSRLIRGELGKDGRLDRVHCCDACYSHMLSSTVAIDKSLTLETREHLLDHVQRDVTPFALAKLAAYYARGTRFKHTTWRVVQAAVRACAHDLQMAWRAPRTRRQLIEKTEIQMTTDLPDVHPYYHRKDMAQAIVDFLLEQFGFEEMAD